MKIIFAASKTEIKELDAHDVDFSLFFDEPILSCWSTYGNGQLHLDGGDEMISLSVEYVGPNQYFLGRGRKNKDCIRSEIRCRI